MSDTEDDPRKIFPGAARTYFRFLSDDFGMQFVDQGPVDADASLLFANETRWVRIRYGRRSYEIGVDIGRTVVIQGEPAAQYFSLFDILTLQRPPVAYPGMAATTADQLARALNIARDLTQQYGVELLQSDAAFETLSARNAEKAAAERSETRAQELRDRAKTAWRRGDYGSVVLAYDEIAHELHLALSPSDEKRLELAQRRLDPDA